MVGGFVLDPANIPPLVTDIAAGIRHAADDDRITGIFLDLQSPSASWASFDEIRDAILQFRESGKPCVAYSELLNSTYYLASACDQVLLAPSGIVTVIGLNAELTFYAGMFDKLEIEAEMLHVGDFKSAVEPYERTEPSESASAAMNYLLDGLYDHMVGDCDK